MSYDPEHPSGHTDEGEPNRIDRLPESRRRMLGRITALEIDGEQNICLAVFPAVSPDMTNVRIRQSVLEAAGIEAYVGSRFFAWGNNEAENPEEVRPSDFTSATPPREEIAKIFDDIA